MTYSTLRLAILFFSTVPSNFCVILLQLYFRLFWNVTFIALVFYTPKMIRNNDIIDIPIYYYAILVFIVSIHDVSE